MTTTGVRPLLGDRYELGDIVGQGGMARVYRAVDTVLARPVAVKLFRSDVPEPDAARAQSEMQTLAALNHPGLVAVYDAGSTGSAAEGPTPFLVMELVDGPTLAAACRDGALSPDRTLEIGRQLAEALAYVHGQGVVHRDVKPANILLAADGRARLTDFGIARIVDSARHTATGLTLGTAPYLSPEQVTGAAVGPPADVYALGLVLLECLTGRCEYAGSPVEAALARLSRPPQIPASLPPPWPALLAAMTATAPQDRPTAEEVAQTLSAAGPPTVVCPTTVQPAVFPAADFQPTVVQRTAVQRTAVRPALLGAAASASRGRSPRHIGLVVAVVAGLLLLLFGLLIISGRPGDAPPRPAAPATQLEQHLTELNRLVRP